MKLPAHEIVMIVETEKAKNYHRDNVIDIQLSYGETTKKITARIVSKYRLRNGWTRLKLTQNSIIAKFNN